MILIAPHHSVFNANNKNLNPLLKSWVSSTTCTLQMKTTSFTTSHIGTHNVEAPPRVTGRSHRLVFSVLNAEMPLSFSSSLLLRLDNEPLSNIYPCTQHPTENALLTG